MGGRTRAASLAASPTMVGAITTLIIIVAVFLSYNANNGLPFVPVYRVSAEICDAARILPNNEVRIGGNRVGVIESIETIDLEDAGGCQTSGGDSASAAARLNLKLDDTAKGLPEDSVVRVRYRSSFGLKYLEIERGSGDDLVEGGTLPIQQAEQTEFDDIGNTFDTPTRESSRKVLEGFGNAFAARGASLNQAIEQLNPLFANLRPVATALSDPSTVLVRLFPELADAARIIAPVAEDQAQLFTNAGIAFAAISSDEDALRDTISEGPETLRVGIDSLPPQRPFLRDFAEFSRLLRPGVRDLRISLPVLNGAIARGAKVLPRTVQMSTDLQGVFTELEQLVDAPQTKSAINRLSTLFDETNSAVSFVGPYQTVCNYWNFWFQFIPEHFSSEDTFGLAERLIAPSVPGLTTPDEFPRNPLNDLSGSQADGRFSDIYDNPITPAKDPPAGLFDPQPANVNPPDPDDEIAQPILHGSPYGPSGTEEAPNCQSGQQGYSQGELLSPGQNINNPIAGPNNIAQAAGIAPFGRTDLFLRQNGVREFWDSP